MTDKTTARSRAEKDAEALKLRHAGISPQRIAKQLGYRTTRQAEEAIVRALEARGALSNDPAIVRALELDRLDRLQQALWVRAAGGDMDAIDRVKKLAEMRVQLAGIAARGQSVLTDAYDKTVASLDTKPEDEALIASGRRIAERIDTAAASGDPQAETKALYLLPHLMNILRELGATPAARAELKAQVANVDTDKRAKLHALRQASAG